MTIPVALTYEDIAVGQVYAFERVITRDDVAQFADLTGDYNPLHIDEEFGARSQFGKNIVHGMLLGGLFSQLVGMHCPGRDALYVAQSLEFRQPVFVGDSIRVRGTVVRKADAVRMVTIKTEVVCRDIIAISGEAKVRMI